MMEWKSVGMMTFIPNWMESHKNSMVPVTANQIIIIFPLLLVYTLLKPLLTTINQPTRSSEWVANVRPALLSGSIPGVSMASFNSWWGILSIKRAKKDTKHRGLRWSKGLVRFFTQENWENFQNLGGNLNTTVSFFISKKSGGNQAATASTCLESGIRNGMISSFSGFIQSGAPVR